MRLQNMNYRNVELTPGLCHSQLQEVIDYLLALDEDRLLHQFRKGAGLPAPGETYYGWYGQGATTLGQWIGALAKLYSVTGDKRLQAKMRRLLDGWAECILPDGYVNFSNENKSTYGFEKYVGGLVDAYEYGGYERAMDLLETITHWADRRFDKHITRDYATYAYLAVRGMHEWYTLGENYYRAYRLSGRPLFLRFAEEWDYTRFWKDMAEKNDKLPPLHAYSHVNSLCGAAMRHEVTNDPESLAAIINGYDVLTAKHLFATGGYGPSEALFGKPGYLGSSLFAQETRDLRGDCSFTNLSGFCTCDDVLGSCEVSCCAWAVFKLTGYLLRLTGEARYAEWAEQLLINGTLAQLPLEKTGRVQYYTNYFRHGGRKDLEDRRMGADSSANLWQCCTGTFPQDVAAYHELIYFQSEDALHVAQYIPSRGSFDLKGQKIALQITGDFPMAQQYIVTVSPEQDTEFCLRLRVPNWAKDAAAFINGEECSSMPVAGQWLSIRRLWKKGDSVLLRFPYHLHWSPIDDEHPQMMALCWGPIVLAADEIAALRGDAEHPEEWIQPVGSETGLFETKPGHDAAFATRTHRYRPFYAIDDKHWYYMYTEVMP